MTSSPTPTGESAGSPSFSIGIGGDGPSPSSGGRPGSAGVGGVGRGYTNSRSSRVGRHNSRGNAQRGGRGGGGRSGGGAGRGGRGGGGVSFRGSVGIVGGGMGASTSRENNSVTLGSVGRGLQQQQQQNPPADNQGGSNASATTLLAPSVLAEAEAARDQRRRSRRGPPRRQVGASAPSPADDAASDSRVATTINSNVIRSIDNIFSSSSGGNNNSNNNVNNNDEAQRRARRARFAANFSNPLFAAAVRRRVQQQQSNQNGDTSNINTGRGSSGLNTDANVFNPGNSNTQRNLSPRPGTPINDSPPPSLLDGPPPLVQRPLSPPSSDSDAPPPLLPNPITNRGYNENNNSGDESSSSTLPPLIMPGEDPPPQRPSRLMRGLRRGGGGGGTGGTTGTTSNNNTTRPPSETPGLERIMRRLFAQTIGVQLPDDDDDDDSPFDLFNLFDGALFGDVNPEPKDVRRPDKLCCPTCMKVHLPVEGSESIEIPKEEEEEASVPDLNRGGLAAGNNNDNDGGGQSVATEDLPDLEDMPIMDNGARNNNNQGEGGAASSAATGRDNNGGGELNATANNHEQRTLTTATMAAVANLNQPALTMRNHNNNDDAGRARRELEARELEERLASRSVLSALRGSGNNEGHVPRLELQLQDYIRVNTLNGANDDDEDADADDEGGDDDDDNDGESASFDSMPPLSSADEESLESLPPLVPPAATGEGGDEERNNESLNASNLTVPGRGGSSATSIANYIASTVTIPPPQSRPEAAAANNSSSNNNNDTSANVTFPSNVAVPGAQVLVPEEEGTPTQSSTADMNAFAQFMASVVQAAVEEHIRDNDEDEGENSSSSEDDSAMPSLESVERVNDGNDEEESTMPPLEDITADGDEEGGANNEEVREVDGSEGSSLPAPLAALRDAAILELQQLSLAERDEVHISDASSQDSSMPPLVAMFHDDERIEGAADVDEVEEVENPNDESDDGASMPPLEDVPESNADASSPEVIPLVQPSQRNDNTTGGEAAPAVSSSSRGASAISGDPEAYHTAEEEEGADDSSSSSLPPLIMRGDMSQSSSSLSMPALIQRDGSSASEVDSDEDEGNARRRIAPRRPPGGGGGGGSLFRRFLQERAAGLASGGERTRNNNNSNNNNNNADRTPTNPLTHLRDYGALRVYAKAICPICLEEHEPIVALRCGHPMCEEDYSALGGYLASDKDAIKAKFAAENAAATTAATATAATSSRNNEEIVPSPQAAEPSEVSSPAQAVSAVASPPQIDIGQLDVSNFAFSFGQEGRGAQQSRATRSLPLRTNEAGGGEAADIPFSIVTSPGSQNAQLQGSERGTVWAFATVDRCENADCPLKEEGHHIIYSISVGRMKHEKCYPLGTKVMADGRGGLWIHEARHVGDGTNYPVLHRDRHGREVHKYNVPRDCGLVSDGDDGVWAMSCFESEGNVMDLKHYHPNGTDNVALVPQQDTDIFHAGRGGKAWVYVENKAENDQNEDILEDGLWILGSSRQKVFSQNSFFCNGPGRLSPDGFQKMWCLEGNERNERADALVLKRYSPTGESEETPFSFSMGASVHGCDSSDGVFVFHQSRDDDRQVDKGDLSYIFFDPETDQWLSTMAGECSIEAKFASDGNGGLWALVPDEEGITMKVFRCNTVRMDTIHSLEQSSFASIDLVQG